jgi:hypothetical protein
MTVTRDVIRDLLPVYFSGDASADTVALIEECVRQDPQLAREVEVQRREFSSQQDLLAPASTLAPGHELETLRRTRTAIQRQKWLLAIALVLTLFPLSFVASDSGLVFMVLRDRPVLGVASWIGAAILWTQYARIQRRMAASGVPGRNWKGGRP